jgi:sodium transport system ATP-binding protein
MIEVKNLHKSFGDVIALQGVTFTAPDGRITGLLGPNGAGKTTTLRIIYTVLKPDRGTATVDGYDTGCAAREVQQRIGAPHHTREHPLLRPPARPEGCRFGKEYKRSDQNVGHARDR